MDVKGGDFNPLVLILIERVVGEKKRCDAQRIFFKGKDFGWTIRTYELNNNNWK